MTTTQLPGRLGQSGTPAAPAGPRLAEDVVIHPPMSQTDPQWTVQAGSQRFLRVGADAAALVRRLDGRSTAQLARELGPPWTVEIVDSVVERLRTAQLLEDDNRRSRTLGRVVVVPPLTVQLTAVDPGRLLAGLRPALARLSSRGLLVGAAVTVVAGLLAGLAQFGRLRQGLAEPADVWPAVAVMAMLLAVNVVHEFGHAAALVREGGRPSRLGVMLFYLTPAFFCDVSDAWRLPGRIGRVVVALTGPAVQFVAAALAAIAALPASGSLEWVLLTFATFATGQALVNLSPFVKFDGYIALMAWRDTPFLRRDCIADAQRVLTRFVFGASTPRVQRNAGRALFGAACIAFPIYLVGVALSIWFGVFAGLGVAGATLGLLVVAYLCVRVLRLAARAVTDARRHGAAGWRIAVGALAVLAAVVGIGLIPVSTPAYAGWWAHNGHTVLVLPPGMAADDVRPGSAVVLQQRGAMLADTVGTATVAPVVRSSDIDAPLSTLVPLTLSSTVRVSAVELTDVRRGPATSGSARVSRPPAPLAVVVARQIAGPLWRFAS